MKRKFNHLFAIKMRLFSAKCTSLARLDGKTAIVTGCNTGIGKCTVKDLFSRGGRVVMACRNVEKANEAAENIKEDCKTKENLGEIVVTELDLSSFQSIRNCANHLLSTEKRIDILINNAGIMMCPESKTKDGFELQFGTNYLGHFLLTLLLLPKICQNTPARIVNVSSMAHSEKNIAGVNVYSLHPGVIKTELGRHIRLSIPWGLHWILDAVTWFIKTPEQGAQTTIYCAVDENCVNESGLYYAECELKEPSEEAKNEEVAQKLWDTSLKLVGLEDNFFSKK